MKIARKYAGPVALAALAFVISADMAHAQIAVAGGGGGLAAPIIQYFMTNFAPALIEVAVIIIAVSLMLIFFSLRIVVMVVIGALILANLNAIVGIIPAGG